MWSKIFLIHILQNAKFQREKERKLRWSFSLTMVVGQLQENAQYKFYNNVHACGVKILFFLILYTSSGFNDKTWRLQVLFFDLQFLHDWILKYQVLVGLYPWMG